MRNLARVGDTFVGVCRCHKNPISVTGIIARGSVKVFSNGQGNSTLGDIAIASCGHTCVISTGSSIVFIELKPAAHIGDAVVGCPQGIISSGAPTVLGS